MKERARHPHHLGLHLPHAGEDVRVKRVAPRKVTVNLESMSSRYLRKPRHNLEGRTQEGNITEGAVIIAVRLLFLKARDN